MLKYTLSFLALFSGSCPSEFVFYPIAIGYLIGSVLRGTTRMIDQQYLESKLSSVKDFCDTTEKTVKLPVQK